MIRYSAPLRVRRPLYPTSAGKCFLAQMTPTRRERHVTALVSGPEAVARVLAELDQIARNGYSMNRGETVPDVYAVASPILINQRVAACLQVAGPSSRMAPRMDELAQLVKTEAQRLSYGSASAR
jgi:DNA-binding IclR family transcriptional regulator